MENIQTDSFFDNKRAVFFLVLGCFLVYANSLGGDFVFDDTMQIVGNNALHSWKNLAGALTTDVWAFQREAGAANVPPPYYRPIFTAYLTIGYQLFGLWQQGWHLLNLAIHTGATVLVYNLFCLLTGGNIRLSLIAGLLFALTPVHVESVSWISGIPDPLAALFFVPSIIFYIRWREQGAKKFLIYALVLFFCALLCKETPIVLPLVLLVWELTLNRRNKPDTNFFAALKAVAIFIVPAVIYLLIRVAVLGQVNWTHPYNLKTPAGEIYLTVPLALVYYIKNIIFPFNLSLIYPVEFIKGFGDPNLWIPLAILAFSAGLLFYFRRRVTPLVWLALALFIVPLLPALNLRVFHPDYLVQDRYLYLPSIGFVLLVAALADKFLAAEKKIYRQAATAAVAVLCVAYAAGTILHNRVWSSGIALWTRAVQTKPANPESHYNLGLANLEAKNYEKAIENFDTALKYPAFDQEVSLIYTNLGLAKKALGANEEAKQNFLKALERDPKSFEATINLGAALFDQADFVGAEAQFRKALQLRPQDVSANYNLARALAKLGRHREATEIYAKILQTVKLADAELLYYAAVSYGADGQKEKAARFLNEAAQLTRDEKLQKQIADEKLKY